MKGVFFVVPLRFSGLYAENHLPNIFNGLLAWLGLLSILLKAENWKPPNKGKDLLPSLAIQFLNTYINVFLYLALWRFFFNALKQSTIVRFRKSKRHDFCFVKWEKGKWKRMPCVRVPSQVFLRKVHMETEKLEIDTLTVFLGKSYIALHPFKM